MRHVEKKSNDRDIRMKQFFAWLPVFVNTDIVYEWRWLETVNVKQIYRFARSQSYWRNLEFLEVKTSNGKDTQTDG